MTDDLQVTDQAVQAGIKALNEKLWVRRDFIDEDGNHDYLIAMDYEAGARAVLEAALPHLRAGYDQGRADATEDIAQALERWQADPHNEDEPCYSCQLTGVLAELAREVGPKSSEETP